MKKVFRYFKYCWCHFIGYRRYVVLTYLLNIFILVLGVITPLLSSRLITMITIKEKIGALYVLGYLVVAQIIIIIIKHFLFKLDKFLCKQVSNKVKKEILNNLLRIEPKMLPQYNDGKIYSLIERDSENVVSYVFTILDSILNFFTGIVIAIIILILCYPLAIVIFITYPIMIITNRYFGKKLKRQQVALLGEVDKYNSYVKNLINNFNDIKGLGGNKKVEEKFADENNAIKSRYFKMNMLQQWNQNCSSLIGLINFICVNVIGIILVVSDKLILGNFIAFNSYSTSFTSSLNSIVSLNSVLQPTFVVLDRVKELSQINEEFLAKEKDKLSIIGNDIVIDNLNLDIDGRRIFSGISFAAGKGDILCIKGSNGCGKTSLFRILKNELSYDGAIYSDSINYSDISYYSIQKDILFLRQNPDLIQLSIFDNLTLFDDANEVTEAMVMDACKRTTLWNDVVNFPNGLYTIIDDSMRLSAGQIQKIQLTRALLSKATIILCDEILANLDVESKNIAIDIINELHNEGRIILFVSHQSDFLIEGQKLLTYEEKK